MILMTPAQQHYWLTKLKEFKWVRVYDPIRKKTIAIPVEE